MVTLADIQQAHSRVKSGADFPQYIHNLKVLGVESYSFSVINGVTTYKPVVGTSFHSPPRFDAMGIAAVGDGYALKASLQKHQSAGSTFLEFCQEAAAAGVAVWITDLKGMQVIYKDLAGNTLLQEKIPSLP